jgi:hypothetical protein
VFGWHDTEAIAPLVAGLGVDWIDHPDANAAPGAALAVASVASAVASAMATGRGRRRVGFDCLGILRSQ